MIEVNTKTHNIFDDTVLSVGDVIKHQRTKYTIVSVFLDRGRIYYIGKYIMKDGVVSYSNVFTYNEDNGKLYKRI